MLRCRVPTQGLAGCSHDHVPDPACSAIENEPPGATYAMAVSYAAAGSGYEPACFSEPSKLKCFTVSTSGQPKASLACGAAASAGTVAAAKAPHVHEFLLLP